MSQVTELFDTISSLIDYHEEDWNILQEEAEVIASWAPEIVTVFYDTLYAIDETKAVFNEGERPKVEKTLADWVATITKGQQRSEFWDHQWFIGLLHVKRGVKNLYLLGMMNRVQQVVLANCVKTYDKDRAYQVFEAFLRISGVISALIAESYGIVVENSTQAGLSKVGMNPALLKRIKNKQIDKMLEEAKANQESLTPECATA